MGNSSSSIAKEIHDQYYTPVATCEWVLKYLRDQAGWTLEGTALEPCVGRGHFVTASETLGLGLQWVTNDLFPSDRFIPDTQVNILDLDTPEKPDFVVTNPPFGSANILAKQSLIHCLKLCDRVAMVLPKGARRMGFLDAQPPHAHLVHDVNLPEMEYELSTGESRSVKTCLQVWEVDRGRVREKIKDGLDLREGFIRFWGSERDDFACHAEKGEAQFQVCRWGGKKMNAIEIPAEGKSVRKSGSWLSVNPAPGISVEDAVSVISSVDVSDYLERSTSLAAFDPPVWLDRVNREAVRRGFLSPLGERVKGG